MKYYSTFPKGFLPLVEEILLQTEGNIQIISKGNNYIYYSSSQKIDEIKKYAFFEKTFFVIKFFNKSFHFDNLLNWIRSNPGLLRKSLRRLGSEKRYRMVGSSPFEEKILIQRKIDEVNILDILDRKNPDFDISIIEEEGYGFIGVKTSAFSEGEELIQKDSLAKEIAYYMLYLSEISEDDIFLDPFCGGGILSLMRESMGEYKKIVCADVDVKTVKKKLEYASVGDDFIVIEDCIDSLESRIVKDLKFNKIVTDPPWGYIQDMGDVEKFYHNMLDNFYKLTTKKSLVIILTPHLDIIKQFLEEKPNRYSLQYAIKGQVSGIDSYIIKLMRL